MDESKLYDGLAAHLDQGVIGAPKSPALIEILKVLFPSEDAEVALHLPMLNRPLSQLKELFPDRPDIEDVLNRMVGRGTVFTSQRGDKEPAYRLLPSVVGWAETPYWAGNDTPEVRKLAPLWLRYREEAYGEEMARGGVPVMRVVPVSETIEDTRQVLPFDALRPMIEATSYRAVAMCPCRQILRYAGEGCDHSLEVCMHFDGMGRFMVEQGMARELDVEETLEILDESSKEGLVHAADNIQGYLSTLCNCCGCCCNFIATKKRMGIHVLSTSNYVSRIEAEACTSCGICEELCPMDAVTLNGEDVVEVDESLCIGCGVCAGTCEFDAVQLVLRGEVVPPPSLQELLAARFKAGS